MAPAFPGTGTALLKLTLTRRAFGLSTRWLVILIGLLSFAVGIGAVAATARS
jgi:hypothetical protein